MALINDDMLKCFEWWICQITKLIKSQDNQIPPVKLNVMENRKLINVIKPV